MTTPNYQGLFNGCIAYYDLRGDAKDMINQYDGTVTGADLISNRLGIVNSAYDFISGNSDHITLGSIGNIKSVAMWVNLDSTTEPIFEGDPNAHLIYANAGTLTYPDWDNAFIDGVDTDTISASTWILIVITSSTDVNCTDIELGLNNATYGDLKIGEVWLYTRQLVLADTKALYDITSKKIIAPYMRRTTQQ